MFINVIRGSMSKLILGVFRHSCCTSGLSFEYKFLLLRNRILFYLVNNIVKRDKHTYSIREGTLRLHLLTDWIHLEAAMHLQSSTNKIVNRQEIT